MPVRDAVTQAAAGAIAANDNRRPAGTLAGNVLTVRLFAGVGKWRPEGGDGPALAVAAFGEEGGALQTPGPLLRMPEGADVVVAISNTLPERLDIHGLTTRPAEKDTVHSIAPGETREIRFAAGAPGTYH